MSTTYHIGCKTCKEHMWIAQTGHIKGQDPDTYLYVYSGEQRTMNLLSTFLQKHKCETSFSVRLDDPDEQIEHVLIFAESGIFWDCEGWTEIDTL